jgi:hypothetical protein
MKKDFAPTRNVSQELRPWEGSCKIKPWDYKVTAVIPCLDTYELVDLCVRLLKLQTVKPFIMIVDTGSSDEEMSKLELLRDDSVELHCLKFNGLPHPSDFPAIAMDFAFSACRTEYLYATHADCFLRRRDFLSYLLNLCPKTSPVVGYEISPRKHEDWKGMVSHTATMYHMPVMDKIGFGWSLRRLANYYNIVDYTPSPSRPGWPDTEILGNYILRKNKITPHLIGKELNFQRKKDDNIDHFRSFTSGRLYSKSYFETVSEWYGEAKKEALERISFWSEEEIKELDVNRVPK